MRQFRLWASNYIPGVHPGMENLILWADGGQIRGIAMHLERCWRCRNQAQLLRAAGRSAMQKDLGSAEIEAHCSGHIFENLQLRMRTWSSLRGLSERGPARRRQQLPGLSAALEFYFGDQVARRIENCAGWDARDAFLIPATKPLFSAFLGKKAADALARKLASTPL